VAWRCVWSPTIDGETGGRERQADGRLCRDWLLTVPPVQERQTRPRLRPVLLDEVVEDLEARRIVLGFAELDQGVEDEAAVRVT
jgi:hypothetical protein